MIEINKKTLFRIFLVVSGCIVLYWLLHATESVNHFFHTLSTIFSPFVAGAAIAFVLNVPMRAFEHGLHRISSAGARRGLAIVLTLIALILVITAVFLLVIPQVIETVGTLIPQVYDFVSEIGVHIENFLAENPEVAEWVRTNTGMENVNWANLVKEVLSMAGKSVSTIVNHAVSTIGSVTGFFMNMFISVVFAIYCLFQKETLARQGRRILYAFLPEQFADGSIKILRLSNSTFSNFLSGQCVEVCILGSMFAVSMAIFKMPYVPLVSVVVAVTAFIPVVGAWVGCVLGAFLILVDDFTLALWFVLLFVVLQQIENNLIYPRVVGTSIGLSGMWVLVAIAVGGKLMGVVGMFLMIPATSVIYTVLRGYTHSRLEKREIDSDKLMPQPPELTSHFKPKVAPETPRRSMKSFHIYKGVKKESKHPENKK